jgi:hypothetical protein
MESTKKKKIEIKDYELLQTLGLGIPVTWLVWKGTPLQN